MVIKIKWNHLIKMFSSCSFFFLSVIIVALMAVSISLWHNLRTAHFRLSPPEHFSRQKCHLQFRWSTVSVLFRTHHFNNSLFLLIGNQKDPDYVLTLFWLERHIRFSLILSAMSSWIIYQMHEYKHAFELEFSFDNSINWIGN